MNDFSYCMPTHFVFGKGKEAETGAYVKQYGGTKVLLHYGGGSVKRSGLLDRVKASLEAEGISYLELGGVKPNPRDTLVYEGIELCRKEGVDFILAVGGGSTIDSSKAIAAGTLYEGDFWDFYAGKLPVPAALPIGAVLTIAAAGSESSTSSVITQEATLTKTSIKSTIVRPRFAVMNPQLTETLPPYQTASGATDICAHVLERYFTNTPEVEVTDRLCEALLLTMIREVPRVLEDPHNYEARANIMWAGTLAHNDTCGVGRQQDWATHHLEHTISALIDCAHGAGLAVMFPAWMKYTYKHDVARFVRLAVNVWGCEERKDNPEETALAGIACWENFFRSIGMPTRLGELGVTEKEIPKLLELLGGEDHREGNFVTLDKKDCEAIYRLAL